MLWVLLVCLVVGGVFEGFEVVFLNNLRSGSLDNVSQHVGERGFHFVKGDVRDAELVSSLVDNVAHANSLKKKIAFSVRI